MSLQKENTMGTYTVGVYVTYFGTKTVEANSEEEALDAVIEITSLNCTDPSTVEALFGPLITSVL